MNPFYEISIDENLSEDNLQLRNLGNRRVTAVIGRTGRNDFDGRTPSTSTTLYSDVVSEDYDNQFALKIKKWSPVYEIEFLIEHHYLHYSKSGSNDSDKFLKQIRYVVLPKLKKQLNSEVQIELVEKWLQSKEITELQQSIGQVVNNNTINFGSVNAPLQFQQNSTHSNLTQHNEVKSDEVAAAFELLSQDLKNVDEQTRKDFELEMDYAMTVLSRGRDIKSQMTNIGLLIKEVGMATFTNLLASPIYEVLKPHLGL